MIISAIVAVDNNYVIGNGNQIPWYLPADLKYFKRTTIHHHVIMGRKTFQSIGRPLPKRHNIVVSRDAFFTATGVVLARSIEEALNIALENGEKEAFIIGGSQIYEASMAFWDRVYLTQIDAAVDGDVYFPKLDFNDWNLVKTEEFKKDEKNLYDYSFKVFEIKS